nr:zinc phosphodiesterase ELAC protein 2-like [Ipomoea batatas]
MSPRENSDAKWDDKKDMRKRRVKKVKESESANGGGDRWLMGRMDGGTRLMGRKGGRATLTGWTSGRARLLRLDGRRSGAERTERVKKLYVGQVRSSASFSILTIPLPPSLTLFSLVSIPSPQPTSAFCKSASSPHPISLRSIFSSVIPRFLVICSDPMGFYIASAVEKGAAALRQCDERTDGLLQIWLKLLVEQQFSYTMQAILLHLMMDGMVDEAITRNHSTTNEAVFSQRYPKIPVFYESHMHKTCIAFDMMSIKLLNAANLPMLPRVLPYLNYLVMMNLLI